MPATSRFETISDKNMEEKGEVTFVATVLQSESVAEHSGQQTTSDQEQLLEFVSLFVHDLESPLASMKYILSLLNEQRLDLGKPRHRQLVASSLTAVERAESILYDLLAVAKAGRLGLEADVKATVLRSVADAAVTLALASATENQIGIEISGESLSPVQADARLLTRVLDNLLYNAVRHTPSGRVIRVVIAEMAGSVEVSVVDGGTGFGEVEPSVVFEKFGQINMRASGKHRGVGLGLYFCRLAVEAMGGTIAAANHAEGGAVFTIRLNKA